MVITADTGFIAKLYMIEPNSQQARATAASLSPPFCLTGLHALELSNCFQRAVFRHTCGEPTGLTPAQANACWTDFQSDQSAGVIEIVEVDYLRVMESARLLTLKHTPVIGTRSLDLLHLAAAMELGADTFLSFDDRQRRAAKAEGLDVLP